MFSIGTVVYTKSPVRIEGTEQEGDWIYGITVPSQKEGTCKEIYLIEGYSPKKRNYRARHWFDLCWENRACKRVRSYRHLSSINSCTKVDFETAIEINYCGITPCKYSWSGMETTFPTLMEGDVPGLPTLKRETVNKIPNGVNLFDKVTCLITADWLEENGEPEEGTKLRTLVENF